MDASRRRTRVLVDSRCPSVPPRAYTTSAPRYTSYPTAVDWEKDPEKAFDPRDYPARLAAAADARPDEAISLYTHVPYCAELCLFCGCNVQISRRRAA